MAVWGVTARSVTGAASQMLTHTRNPRALVVGSQERQQGGAGHCLHAAVGGAQRKQIGGGAWESVNFKGLVKRKGGGVPSPMETRPQEEELSDGAHGLGALPQPAQPAFKPFPHTVVPGGTRVTTSGHLFKTPPLSVTAFLTLESPSW